MLPLLETPISLGPWPWREQVHARERWGTGGSQHPLPGEGVSLGGRGSKQVIFFFLEPFLNLAFQQTSSLDHNVDHLDVSGMLTGCVRGPSISFQKVSHTGSCLNSTLVFGEMFQAIQTLILEAAEISAKRVEAPRPAAGSEHPPPPAHLFGCVISEKLHSCSELVGSVSQGRGFLPGCDATSLAETLDP